MFRAVHCSSAGGQIVLLQPLVSSLSVNGRTVCRLWADCSPLSTGTLYGRLQSDDTRGCNNLSSWRWARYCSKHVEDYNV